MADNQKPEKKKPLHVVMVGHVDHGKSTLIGRLLYETGSLPESIVDDLKAVSEEFGKEMEFAYALDALEEEREANITIDTSQSFFSTEKRDFILIDAPGHLEFIQNMLTGSSLAEAAVLIVDASRGLEEQTRRHAYLLHLLGVNRVIVALNKMDLAQWSEQTFQKLEKEARDFLEGFGTSLEAVVPLSAALGENIVQASEKLAWYSGPSLLQALEAFPERRALPDMPLRFAVQGQYDFVDDSPILVGRVESGELKAGEKLVSCKSGQALEIEELKKWNLDLEVAGAGDCVGLTVKAEHLPERGEILLQESDGAQAEKKFQASLIWLDERAADLNESFLCRLSTQTTELSISTIFHRVNSSSLEELPPTALENTEVAELELHSATPIFCEDFRRVEELGRFVLERNGRLCAAGVVRKG